MFHSACKRSLESLERHNSSLLARIADLESRNEQLLEAMLEERKAAVARETDLSDRLLAIASPMAARMIGAARPATPAAPPPAVQRPKREPASGPLLAPRSTRYGSVADIIERQRRTAAAAAAAAGAATAAPSSPDPGPHPVEESNPEPEVGES